jgi:predicted PurR-regulated permease PerM
MTMATTMQRPKNNAADALVGIWAILLMAFVITVLYVGKDILIPLALAALITFLLAPLVRRLERWLGRFVAVLLAVLMLFALIGGVGWMLTTQVVDLAAKLPDYQANIEAKIRAFRLPTGGTFARFTHSLQQLQEQLPGATQPSGQTTEKHQKNLGRPTPTTASASQPVPVEVVESESRLTRFLSAALSAMLSPLGTAGLVLLLVIFMLLKRETCGAGSFGLSLKSASVQRRMRSTTRANVWRVTFRCKCWSIPFTVPASRQASILSAYRTQSCGDCLREFFALFPT